MLQLSGPKPLECYAGMKIRSGIMRVLRMCGRKSVSVVAPSCVLQPKEVVL